MTVDIIIYICLYVCGCIILFDIIFALSVFRYRKLMPKRKAYILKNLSGYLSTKQNDKKRTKRLHRKCLRLLEDENWLLTYSLVFKELVEDDAVDNDALNNFTIDLFENLSRRYEDKKNENKALFAHAALMILPASKIVKTRNKSLAKLTKMLISYMHSSSLYVRANAFSAVVRISESAEEIFDAVSILNSNLQFRDSKIFSDYMLGFQGDIDELIKLLLDSIYEFSTELQVMVLSYLRLLPMSVSQEKYYPIIYDFLCSEQMNEESIIAAIRYFSKHSYEPAFERLLVFLDDNDVNTNVYSAIASSSIRNYPSERTINILTKNLSSRDWFVRFNSAESLLFLDVDFEEIIKNSDDKYAKEILIHRNEVFNLKKRERITQ